MAQINFKWSNFAKPTPKNLEFVATSLRRIVAVVAGAMVIEEASWGWTFSVLLTGAILDELKNFFGFAAAAGDQDTVSVTFPSTMADQVDVTQETKTKEE